MMDYTQYRWDWCWLCSPLVSSVRKFPLISGKTDLCQGWSASECFGLWPLAGQRQVFVPRQQYVKHLCCFFVGEVRVQKYRPSVLVNVIFPTFTLEFGTFPPSTNPISSTWHCAICDVSCVQSISNSKFCFPDSIEKPNAL